MSAANQKPLIRILHLEDNPSDHELIEATIKGEGIECELHLVDSRVAFESALNTHIDLIISDHSLPSFDGSEAFKIVSQRCPEIPFIFVTGSIGEESAIEKMKNGATDYVLKHRLERLAPAVRRALDESAERRRREKAEEQLREKAMLLERARDAIYVRDLEGRVTYWNHGAERLYGWTASEAIGKRTQDLIYQCDSQALQQMHQEVLEKGEWIGELQHVTKDDRILSVQARRNLLYDENSKPYAVLSINTDVTEVNLIREQLLKTQRLDSIGALAGGIAHDLNNMLAPILMAAELLDTEIESDMGKRTLGMMKTSALRSAEMVKQILTFARGNGAEYSLLAAGDLISEIAKLVTETFPRNIRVQTHFEADLWNFSGNRTRIHQVLLNLCVNARDAMPHGGMLQLNARNATLIEKRFATLETPVSGSFILFEVADSGSGIPAHLMRSIFEPFFTTKAVGKGTGLGLSTVMGIVKAHNGFVEVESAEGKGTTFRIYLPADQPKQD